MGRPGRSSVEVATVGNIVADLAVRGLPRLPQWGRSRFVEEAIDLRVGGNGAIFAEAYAGLGGSVRLFGQVGRDSFGSEILRHLRRSGVELRGVTRSVRARTATTVALVHRSGERTFLHHGGASFALAPSDLDIEELLQARHLHYGGYYYLPRLEGRPARRLLKEAKHRGLTTSLDTGWDPSGRWLAALDDCLAYADLFMPNEVEAEQLARRGNPRANGRFLLTRGPRMVLVKLGASGCLVVTPKGDRHVRAYRVGARDATGAGDVFNAGFVYGRLHGWSVDRSARLANAYGAMRVALRDDRVRTLRALEVFAEQTPVVKPPVP